MAFYSLQRFLKDVLTHTSQQPWEWGRIIIPTQQMMKLNSGEMICSPVEGLGSQPGCAVHFV